ncbi:hypothetical protein DHW03_05475 [Pedobacter yonginense]|uniref:Cold-shock protein n=1 Tax=Pedobacter yonginense TaxID=651869 RepID=A0A317EQV3_9SPHI|nr:hypothetical protein [Pedobacter yonginense]PWS29270.1 hypothetical protein DHW03_05475 [Pedobacter yonginense]
MNSFRKGQIVDLDFNSSLGTIIDENGQDIPFELNDRLTDIAINAEVVFQIELSQKGLRAVEIAVS